jgi:hypothetical protein
MTLEELLRGAKKTAPGQGSTEAPSQDAPAAETNPEGGSEQAENPPAPQLTLDAQFPSEEATALKLAVALRRNSRQRVGVGAKKAKKRRRKRKESADTAARKAKRLERDVLRTQQDAKIWQLRRLAFSGKDIGKQLGITDKEVSEAVVRWHENHIKFCLESAEIEKRLLIERLEAYLLQLNIELKDCHNIPELTRGIETARGIISDEAKMMGHNAPTVSIQKSTIEATPATAKALAAELFTGPRIQEPVELRPDPLEEGESDSMGPEPSPSAKGMAGG